MESEINTKKIEKAIVEAIAFFDMFDFPLTLFEIWKYCGIKCSLSEIRDNLENEKIENKNGFSFLRGREDIIKTRMKRYNITDRKFKKAIWVTKIFRFIPWIKMIAVANIYGANNAKKSSDIDLIIVAENKRIWVTRFFCVGIAKILDLRPKPNRKKNSICLSFFVTEDAMNLEKLKLNFSNMDFNNVDDIIFIYWVAHFMPIYQRNNTYHKFVEENKWLKNDLPNWFQFQSVNKRLVKKKFSTFYRDIIDLLFGELEKRLMKWQLKIMPERLKTMMNQDTKVVINEEILKLHSNDKREEYLNIYTKKLDEIFGKNN